MEEIRDFGWALCKMRDGYTVKREGVPGIKLAADEPRFIAPDDTYHGLTDEDLLADDWELAD